MSAKNYLAPSVTSFEDAKLVSDRKMIMATVTPAPSCTTNPFQRLFCRPLADVGVNSVFLHEEIALHSCGAGREWYLREPR